jgi:glycerol-3-phosphate acyltransferase PlsY
MQTSWLIAIVAGYLCGSIPFGLLIGLARGVDIRTAGSGNIGATNAARVLGRKWGMVCFALDVAKGFAPVFIAGLLHGVVGDPAVDAAAGWSWVAVAIAAVLGHMFPVWLKFKGGKGVATGFGVMLGVWPLLAYPVFVALVVWIVLFKTTRYVSLASMVAAVMMPLAVLAIALCRGADLTQRTPFLIVTGLMAVLVIVRHRANITRLIAGNESRM